jgi:hypothetical protein
MATVSVIDDSAEMRRVPLRLLGLALAIKAT